MNRPHPSLKPKYQTSLYPHSSIPANIKDKFDALNIENHYNDKFWDDYNIGNLPSKIPTSLDNARNLPSSGGSPGKRPSRTRSDSRGTEAIH